MEQKINSTILRFNTIQLVCALHVYPTEQMALVKNCYYGPTRKEALHTQFWEISSLTFSQFTMRRKGY